MFPVETSVQLILTWSCTNHPRGRFSTELTLVWGGNLILAGIFSPWKDIPNNEGLEHEVGMITFLI